MTDRDVTVAIPLHRSGRWVDNVASNVRRLVPHAQIVISDATQEDDALARLQQMLGEQPGLTWLGRRDLGRGYVPHYNDLLARATTPFFMWLPADDEIEGAYVERCMDALRADAGLVMCVGQVRPVPGVGMCEPIVLPMPPAGYEASPTDRLTALVLDWEPWILFRSVFRVSAVHPIQDTQDGASADAFWILSLLAVGRAQQIPSVIYGKRFYRGSTHAQMRVLSIRDRATWALRELTPHLGLADTAALFLRVGARRSFRHVTRRGYLQGRRLGACGHTICWSGTGDSEASPGRRS